MKKTLVILTLVFTVYACNRNARQEVNSLEEETIITPALTSVLIDSTALSKVSTTVKSFYEKNENRIAWTDEKNRQELLNVLDTLSYDGILLKKKDLEALKNWHDTYESLSDETLITADLLYSSIYMKSVNALYNGNYNPRRLYNDWDLDPKAIKSDDLLLNALKNNQLSASYDTLRPKHQMYTHLRKKYKQLLHVLQDTLTAYPSIKENDTVVHLDRLRNHLSFLSFLPKNTTSSNIYDKDLKAAILKFQTAKKLAITGTINKETIKNIEESEAFIAKKLLINMERWKWFPRKFSEHFILINIPEYNVITVSGQDTIATHRAVVGTQKRKTPILSSVLTSVVINPTWTVPPTILKNDVVPKATQDSTYFHRQNFAIYSKNSGKEIAIKDWNPNNYNSYRYVQRGGAGNTLGRIKFMFQNNHAVYFHDTPSKYQFDRKQRGLSSGCIRVEFPFKMAQFIFDLQENQLSEEEIKELLATEKLKNISTKKTPIHIYLLYWTAEVDQNGLITYYDDLYTYDDDLYNRLKQ